MSLWDKMDSRRLLIDLSLWSGSLACLADSINSYEQYADFLHVDVGDGHFIPSLLFFPDLVAALRSLTEKPIHVHLMVDNPSAFIKDFAQAGANLITFHIENKVDISSVIQKIKDNNAAAGLAVQVETPVSAIEPYIDTIDFVVMMGTALGIKGVGINEQAYSRLEAVKNIIRERGLLEKVKVSADGGIRQNTVPLLRGHGADCIVPGSLLFKSDNIENTVNWLHSLPSSEDT
jgi:ribulose-phosphate 3-epimerase